jgi:PAS domain S-box-containing protein
MRALLLAEAAEDATWLAQVLRESRHPLELLVRVGDDALAEPIPEEHSLGIVLAVVSRHPPARLLSALESLAALPATLVLITDSLGEVVEPALRLGACICLRDRGLGHLRLALDRAVAREKDERARAQAKAFEQGQREVLAAVGSGALADVLTAIVRLIERQSDGMLCSILLLDADGRRLRIGAAPHLPAELSHAIDGAEIGPAAGSCGAAAYRREPVIIEDVGTHPNWVAYRHLVLPHGLRACWSTPILSSGARKVLGTFAMYHREARGPTDLERSWVDRASYLAAIAIERDRASAALRTSEARYRQIVDTAYEGVWLLDGDARTVFVNRRTCELLGRPADEIVGHNLVEFMDEVSRARAQGEFLARLRTLSEQGEFCFRQKDGSVFWALLAGSPIRDHEQALAGALCMVTDISELKRVERMLRRREAEARAVFDNAAFGLALLDEQGRVLRSNPALHRFFGRDESELRGVTLLELAHPDDRAGNAAAPPDWERGEHLSKQSFLAPKASECLGSVQTEGRYLRKDGAVVFGRLTASLMIDEGKRQVVVMMEDVTDRRRMEEAIRSGERLRSLMYGAVSDILFYIGVEGGDQFRFLSVNPAFLRATGLVEADVVGRLVSDVIPEPSRSTVVENYRRAIRERHTITWDEMSRYPAGVKYGEVAIRPIFDENGHCTNLVGSVHDVTERRLASERLAEQAALLDHASDAILVRDLDGVIRYWNHGAERLLGWSSREATGRSVRDLLYADRETFERAQAAVLQIGEWTGEIPRTNRQGKRLVIAERWTLLRAAGGQPASILVIGTDRTERVTLEALIARSQRLESLGSLAGGLAHDFSNALAIIGCSIELARRRLTEADPARAPLEDARLATDVATDLVRRILTFSRREQLRLDRTPLQPAVEEALRLLRPTVPRTIEMRTSFDPETPEVLADAIQVQQIVMNLGTNAVQAMGPGGGSLSVRLERAVLNDRLVTSTADLPPGSYARLVVADTGTGMDEPTLERIFEPLFTTKPPDQGTGLGLSVVHGIVRSHEGGVVVRSEVGSGSEFSVYFPAAVRQTAGSASSRSGAV